MTPTIIFFRKDGGFYLKHWIFFKSIQEILINVSRVTNYIVLIA